MCLGVTGVGLTDAVLTGMVWPERLCCRISMEEQPWRWKENMLGDCAWVHFLNSCRSGKFNMSNSRKCLNYGCISMEGDYFSMGWGK